MFESDNIRSVLWSPDQGTILDGEGTPTITVGTAGGKAGAITASVSV